MKTEYNKIVHVEDDGEILVLEYVFEDLDGKGAVGTRFYPISKEEYDERTTFESVLSYLKSAAECPPQYRSYRDWAKDICENNEQEDAMFSISNPELWDEMRSELKLSETDAYIFECVGGGRMFDSGFYGNKSSDLSEVIRKFESYENT